MTAYQQCACRPGCLARLVPDDVVLLTDDGYALTEHLDAYPAEQSAIEQATA